MKHVYKISVSNDSTTHTATYTNKAAALKAAKDLARDMSNISKTGYSIYIDDDDVPIHEGSYIDEKPMLGY